MIELVTRLPCPPNTGAYTPPIPDPFRPSPSPSHSGLLNHGSHWLIQSLSHSGRHRPKTTADEWLQNQKLQEHL
ncbi:MAG TPA: hypothetical protein VJM08_03505 [Anaerolineales bacterium]|nr:hypothetical protein [Anaerolineales bacterium]